MKQFLSFSMREKCESMSLELAVMVKIMNWANKRVFLI